MTDAPTRLFLVDDQELVRAGFRMVLDAQDDMTVVGEAGDGVRAIEAVAQTRPDVVLMDIRMPRMDGVETTRRLLQGAPAGQSPRVLVLTTFDLDEYVFAALRAGASGFLLKDAGPAELLAAIRAVHQGDAAMAPSTTRRLLERFVPDLPDARAEDAAANRRRAAAGRLDVLTEREREVLEAVGRGLTNTEIAAELYLAEATVKTHIGRVLHKLDLRDRVQMVITAYETGLVGRPG
ncbi:DNA-binding response regulator, LuxR family [Serinicoccus hydrothermalis]|uniref:DNA-binding response regulator, LuxR family n=1 Tax=Serinicoccus hydrothermalis TaxID=1758689 RepID=A0A1B1NE73_9MICO|nr:response regulator transcription factor [Serinicoccus hydrothermalis]ANS79740.1 DNA-binding response regulator, LuxR family [Serinicoccus hydrothermalis]